VFGAGRLIVGTSGSPGSLHALRYGEVLARAHDAVLIPVIAWELPGGDRTHRIASSRELGQACRDLACQQLRDALMAVWGEVPDEPRVQPHVERGPAGWVLVNLACRPDDVLVVGAGRRGPRTPAWPHGAGVLAAILDRRAGPSRPRQAGCLRNRLRHTGPVDAGAGVPEPHLQAGAGPVDHVIGGAVPGGDLVEPGQGRLGQVQPGHGCLAARGAGPGDAAPG